MVLLMVDVSLPITLFEGWLQLAATVGKIESPQKVPGFGAGFVQESWVQRKVARFVLLKS